ncbi:hypothetical protein [uncultured Alistipes sp.]|uniref:hypothetical protein n=1 Tax=uncultured Alistipes sp. TaxID=538949 RepID=UPI002595CCAF|nr:hypothetical protein [uncultured Alistipes sp.]
MKNIPGKIDIFSAANIQNCYRRGVKAKICGLHDMNNNGRNTGFCAKIRKKSTFPGPASEGPVSPHPVPSGKTAHKRDRKTQSEHRKPPSTTDSCGFSRITCPKPALCKKTAAYVFT